MSAERINPVADINELVDGVDDYLDSAEVALENVNAYNFRFHQSYSPELFASTGLSDTELKALSAYGTILLEDITTSRRKKGEYLNPLVLFTGNLVPIVKKYRGIQTDIFYRGDELEKENKQWYHGTTEETFSKQDLDYCIETVGNILTQKPTPFDAAILVGLGVIRFAQVYTNEAVQKDIQSGRFPVHFKKLSPFNQAVSTMLTYIDSGTFDRYITHILGKYINKANLPYQGEVKSRTKALLEELDLILKVGTDLNQHEDRLQRTAELVSAMINKVHEDAELLVSVQNVFSTDLPDGVSPEEFMQRLEIESVVLEATRNMSRRARTIADKTRSLFIHREHTIQYRVPEKALPPLVMMEFAEIPVSTTPLHEQIRQWEASEAVGRMAAQKALAAEQKQVKEAELEHLRAKHAMTKSEIKKIDGSNELSAMLVRGQLSVGDEKIKPLLKDEAYMVVRLVYRLHERLKREDQDEVFLDLFDALDTERELVEELGGSTNETTLNQAYDWLLRNLKFLRASSVEAFYQTANSLRAIAK